MNLKQLYKNQNFNTYELIFIGMALIAIPTLAIIFGSWWLVSLASVFTCLCAIFTSKGKFIGVIFGLMPFYCIAAYLQGFYGECLIFICLTVPLYVFALISWIRNQNPSQKAIVINKIKLREWLLLFVAAVALFFALYFLLRAFNTQELIISTLSCTFATLAFYLSARRSKSAFILFMLSTVVFFILWLTPIINGNLTFIPLLFAGLMNFVNDFYGLYNWNRLEKSQAKLASPQDNDSISKKSKTKVQPN